MATSSSTSSTSSRHDADVSSNSSDDALDARPVAFHKRARYACTFTLDSTRFPWAKVSRKGPSFAYCCVCSRDISVAYGGTKDLCKHESRAVHKQGCRSVAGTSSLTSYFNQPGSRRAESVIEAEVKFGFFLAEHYLAFNIADHCSKLFPSLFHDSAIANAFKCGRTKATAIVKVLAREVMKDIVAKLQQSRFFSLHTDETTDITVYQQCAVMLRFFDEVEGCVRCVFFKLHPVQRADAQSIFEALDSNFSSSGPICYSSLVGLGSDGANVMLGSRNSVLTRLRDKQPGLVSFHCNCHLAALIANHASKVLPGHLEDLTIQVWYFFQKSPKRSIEEFQAFVDAKPHKLLKAGQTRWLSLEMCVNRLLEQYDALLSFFRSSEERLATIQRITTTLERPLTKLYLMFLSNALQVINAFNKLMQVEAPTIHFLFSEVQAFVKKLFLRFMAPAAVQEKQVSQINIEDSSQYLPVNAVYVGDKARRYLEAENDLTSDEIRGFYEVCREFWLSAVKYAVKKLPVESDFLTNLTWLNPGVQEYGMLDQIIQTLRHLPQVVKEEERAAIEEEYLDYCTCEQVKELDAGTSSIDGYWHKISQLQDPTGQPRYPVLTRLAKSILIIPHGNADIERSFSKMGLNKT